MSGSGGVARRTPVDLLTERGHASSLLGVAVALALLAVWLVADPRTPDMAAQAYRVGLFGQLGFALFDARWYAGHELLGYSLLFPALGSLLGLRLAAFLSVLASVALFERLVGDVYGRGARWGVAFFALAAVGDVWSGRLTFALGVSLALGATLAFARSHRGVAGVLAALCAAASPVAGVLLALAGLTDSLSRRNARGVLVLAAPAIAVALVMSLLFGDGGVEPFPATSFAVTLLVIGAFALALPSSARTLRIGALVYAVACATCLLVASPMGSNVQRYAVLLAGPLLLCALLGERGRPPASADAPAGAPREAAHAARPARAVVLGTALALIALWVVWGPVRETLAVAGNRSTSASYYVPVERFLAAHTRGPARVEVPLTRSHWEAALLAPSVSLARGWEKQLEERYDATLLSSRLSAASYDSWLHEQAVDYVALPYTPLDPSSAREGRLIAGGLPFLHEVFASRHWRIYAVDAPTPIVSGPGRLVSLGHDSFTLRASAPGRILVRVHFTRYWTIARGLACVVPAPGGWTAVNVRAPGTVVIDARFSLGRALGLAGTCHAGAG